VTPNDPALLPRPAWNGQRMSYLNWKKKGIGLKQQTHVGIEATQFANIAIEMELTRFQYV